MGTRAFVLLVFLLCTGAAGFCLNGPAQHARGTRALSITPREQLAAKKALQLIEQNSAADDVPLHPSTGGLRCLGGRTFMGQFSMAIEGGGGSEESELAKLTREIEATQGQIAAVESRITDCEAKIESVQASGDAKMLDYWIVEKTQLRDREEQLRDREKQLRDKELLLLGQQQSAGAQQQSADDPSELFGHPLSDVPDEIRSTLLVIWHVFVRAKLPLRDLSSDRMPERFPLTTAAFGESPAGREEALAKAMEFVRTRDQDCSGSGGRVALGLTFGSSGTGKSFFTQSLYAKLMADTRNVVLPVTLNFVMMYTSREERLGPASVLGVRAAFAFFTKHGKDRRREFVRLVRSVQSSFPTLDEVVEAVQWLVGREKRITVLVDEVAAMGSKHLGAMFDAMKETADALQSDGMAVRVIVSGLNTEDWTAAGIRWESTLSQRGLVWFELQPALDEDSRERTRGAMAQACKDQGFVDDEGRLANLIDIAVQYGTGHWRTCELMLLAVEEASQLPPDANASKNLIQERRILKPMLEQAEEYWKLKANFQSAGREKLEAMSYLVACSLLRVKVRPAQTLGTPSGRSIAEWRFQCFELSAIDGPTPQRASRVVPLLPLPQTRTWAAEVASEATWVPSAMRNLAREHEYMIAQSLRATARSFEEVLAVRFAACLHADYVRNVFDWRSTRRATTGDLSLWPSDEVLSQSSDLSASTSGALLQGYNLTSADGSPASVLDVGSTGEVWRTDPSVHFSGVEQAPDLDSIELTSFFDSTKTCDRPLRVGDVVVPGEGNPGWDFLVLVKVAGEDGESRPGLLLVDCKLQGLTSKQPALKNSDVKDFIDGMMQASKALYLYGDTNTEPAAKWAKLDQHIVRECDITIAYAVNGNVDVSASSIRDKLRKASCSFTFAWADREGIEVGMGASLSRLPMLSLAYYMKETLPKPDA